MPQDQLDHAIADLMRQDDALRSRLTGDIYLVTEMDISYKMDQALACRLASEAAYQRLQSVLKQGVIHKNPLFSLKHRPISCFV